MRILIGWRAVYENGARYESHLWPWDRLPVYGMQALFKYWVNQEDPQGEIYTQVQVDQDSYYPYYVKSPADAIRVLEHQRVKMGSQMDSDRFGKMMAQEEKFARENPVVNMVDSPYI